MRDTGAVTKGAQWISTQHCTRLQGVLQRLALAAPGDKDELLDDTPGWPAPLCHSSLPELEASNEAVSNP